MRKWLKLLLVIAIFAVISVILYFILQAFGLSNIDSIRSFVENSKYAIITFMLIDILISTCFVFIPVIDTGLIVLSVVLFGGFRGFIISLIGNIISSSILFFLGDKFGEHLAIKLIGKDELDNTQNLVDKKSKIIFPILLLLPFSPDEALCLIAGMTKMKYLYFLLCLIICRAICIGIVCLASCGLINIKI